MKNTKTIAIAIAVAALAMVSPAMAGIIANQPDAGYGFVETSEGVFDIVALKADPLAIAYVIGSDDGVVALGAIQAVADATSNNGSFGAFASDAWGFMGATGSLAQGAILISGNTFVGPLNSSVKLYSVDETTQAFTELASYNIIPEPMTIGLLGLGGLLIARKRKGN